MIWANPRDVILLSRSSYYYDDMSIIPFFPALFWFHKNPEKVRERLSLRFMTSRHHVFCREFHA